MPVASQIDHKIWEVIWTYVKRQSARTVYILITIYPYQGVAAFIERTFQTDHDKLKGFRRSLTDVIGNLCYIRVVESRVYFVKHEEWCRLIASRGMSHRRYREGITRHLWTANNSARAATVFSPPESCSMSLKRFMGGIA